MSALPAGVGGWVLNTVLRDSKCGRGLFLRALDGAAFHSVACGTGGRRGRAGPAQGALMVDWGSLWRQRCVSSSSGFLLSVRLLQSLPAC